MAEARLAEILGSLSLATERAAGVPRETMARVAIVATRLAESMGMTAEERRDVYYAALLRHLGCTSFAHEAAWYGAGDDIALQRALAPVDRASPRSVVGHVVRGAGVGHGARARLESVARVLADPALTSALATAHAEQASHLAERLGATARVVEILAQSYERFDGKGSPAGLRAEQLLPLARVLHVAHASVLHTSIHGVQGGLDVIRARRDAELDPVMCDRLFERAGELERLAREASVWDELLAAEPTPTSLLPPGEIVRVARAFALFVDLKSPFTLGHSTGVSRIVAAALARAGLSDEEQERGRVLGLLHDLGRAAIPNGIWDKPGPLTKDERREVELHPRETERVLARSPLLAELGHIAGMHHERLDGSGYGRGVRAGEIPELARILAAADVYHSLREQRPQRPARSLEEAGIVLLDAAKAGRLDARAVSRVLAAVGHRRGPDRVLPAGLDEREVDVLVHMARGLPAKEIGRKLYVSPRVASQHMARITEKTGVKTRASAALFAAEHELVTPAR